jgi:hypothetical protein
MNDGTRQALAMVLIGGSAMAGLAGMPIWLSLIGGLGLTIIAILEQQKLRARFVAVGSASMLTGAQLGSLVNSFITAGAAWVVGCLLRLLVQAMQ